MATNLVIPQIGCKALLNIMIGGWTGYKLHLFSNNVTVTDTTLIGSLTESTFGGYAAAVVSGWSAAANDASNGAFTQASLVTFTPTGAGLPANIYGYYFTDAAGSPTLLWAQNDPNAPVVLSNTSQSYTITPYFDFNSQF